MIVRLVLSAIVALFLSAVAVHAADVPKPAAIPVILDTDIGDDIDDTWALALLLRSPEVDLKLVVGDYGKPNYRARLIAKILQSAGRSDIPVGVGIALATNNKVGGGQSKWVGDYDLKSYPGKVYDDGVQVLIDTIMAAPRPITLIAIGPTPNLAEALKRRPEIATKAKFVGMDGSVRLGYGGAKKPAPEWNIKADVKSAQKVFTAPWEMTITPLDTCGLVQLKGAKYKAIRDSQDPIAKLVIENYRIWCGDKPERADSASSTLYDTVAAYLSFSQELANMEKLNIRVSDDGMTLIDPQGKPMNVAASWKDLSAYEDLLVKRLTSAGK